MIKVLLKDGGIYTITKEQVRLWSELYPSVDIEKELGILKEMWTNNAIPRKTSRNINKFINNHLKNASK